MKIDDASDLLTGNEHLHTVPVLSGELNILQIEAEDALEAVLVVLGKQMRPVIILLPASGTALCSPEDLVQLRQLCRPEDISLVIPRNRVAEIAKVAYQQGFPFTSSLTKAIADFRKGHPVPNQQQVRHSNDLAWLSDEDAAALYPSSASVSLPDVRLATPFTGSHSIPLLERESSPSVQLSAAEPTRGQKKALSKRKLALAAVVTLLLFTAGFVLPLLFTVPTPTFAFTTTLSGATSMGSLSFTSSGQLNLNSAQGINNVLTVTLQQLTPPAQGKALYAWLMSDPGNDDTKPLLLGILHLHVGRPVQLSYTTPDHRNLLAIYSRFLVTEEPAIPPSNMPALDAKTWRYQGAIPNMPIPGDENHYSFLSHLRHLLAKDPTLQAIGVPGGLNIQLYQNTQKLLEASSAARDDWTNHKSALIRGQVDRIIDYLDGEPYAWRDLPQGTPFLIDQKTGRIGLITIDPNQSDPGYLHHINTHLFGLVNSPGSTAAQKQLASQIDNTINQVNASMQTIRTDARQLVKMNDQALQQAKALSLLNEIYKNANTAYVGQLNTATGETQKGVVWIYGQLQKLAMMPIYATPSK